MNWRTTITGLVGAAATLLSAFGFNLPAEVQTAIIAITVFILGFVSQDAAKK